MKKKKSWKPKVILVSATVILIMVIAILLNEVSYILALVFLLLAETFVFSLLAARDVVEIEVEPRLQEGASVIDSRTQNEIELKTVITELQADGRQDGEGRYIKMISFSEFFDQPILLIKGEKYEPFDEYNAVQIEIRFDSEMNFTLPCVAGDGSEKVNTFLYFDIPNVPKQNKLLLAVIMALLLTVFTCFCWGFNQKFTQSNEDVQFNLQNNLNAIASVESLQLEKYMETDEQVYYKELPEVHLLVITKDQNTFLPDGEYFNPEIVNTVLMFYEDNFSGCRDLDPETGMNPEEEIVRAAANTTYYNLTELYLNLPVVLEDGETYTFGELFSGTVVYQEKSGYSAVKSFFRDMYHINIASVTEIPEKVFADCYGVEERMGINVSRDFVRFIYDNYQMQSPQRAIYVSNAAKNVLSAAKPYYPTVLCQNLEKLAKRMGVDSDEGNLKNGMLFLDGSSIVAFGNSLRVVSSHSEYDLLHEKGYYLNPQNFYHTEWGDYKLNEIIHSNWDVVMVNILENISSMNNGTYTTLCLENHQDSLADIRSSLDQEVLHDFVKALTESNTILGTEKTQHDYVFRVRNLDPEMESVLGEENVYLCNEPLDISPYTNRQIKKILYYCLKYVKEVGDT